MPEQLGRGFGGGDAPGLTAEALYPLGCTLYHRGEFAEADRYLSRGVQLYNAATCREHARRSGQNSGR